MRVKIFNSSENNNILDLIKLYLDTEKIEYFVVDKIDEGEEFSNLIYILNDVLDKPNILFSAPTIMISSEKCIFKNQTSINYIITDLIKDETYYSDVQMNYLLKNGIYNVFIQKLGELLENQNNYNGLIYDLREVKNNTDDWIFKFDSITETYEWLSKKNKKLDNKFVRKVINFYSEKVYDDSLREINYLTEKLLEIKDKKNVIDIFICTKEELHKFRENYFFKMLIKNICDTYKIFLIDKEVLSKNESEIYNNFLDGIAIYDDCVYRDTYSDEFSLGYVDCKKEIISLYNDYFDYVIKKYGHQITMESDLDEF